MTATKQRIGVLKGTFLRPGVSKNGRLYTRAHVAAAVTEMQDAIESGNAPPLAMLTHHGARDPRSGDVTRTAAMITRVGLSPEGNATFEADIADTQAGRDVAALTTPANPYLRGVSIAGVWKGVPRTVRGPKGEACETADGFSVMGIDLTHNPGVEGAEISSAQLTEAAAAGLVLESYKEATIVENVDQAVTDPARAAAAATFQERVERAETDLTQASTRDLWAVAQARVYR